MRKIVSDGFLAAVATLVFLGLIAVSPALAHGAGSHAGPGAPRAQLVAKPVVAQPDVAQPVVAAPLVHSLIDVEAGVEEARGGAMETARVPRSSSDGGDVPAAPRGEPCKDHCCGVAGQACCSLATAAGVWPASLWRYTMRPAAIDDQPADSRAPDSLLRPPRSNA